mgnify:CR=1 FL=1
MCVFVRENRMYTENKKTVLQREAECAYVVTFSISSRTRATSYERGGALTTYEICVIELEVL